MADPSTESLQAMVQLLLDITDAAGHNCSYELIGFFLFFHMCTSTDPTCLPG